jgi:hypothetical protein
MDNPEILAIFGTFIRHRTKTNKTYNTTQYTIIISPPPNQKLGVLAKGKEFLLHIRHTGSFGID